MIQLRSKLNLADNSGAKSLVVVGIRPGSKRRFGYLGEIVTAVVEGADINGQVKDKEVLRAVIVRVRKEEKRMDGSAIRFDDNAAVVIDKNGMPRGTRIFGPIAREVKDRGFARIISLAPEVV